MNADLLEAQMVLACTELDPNLRFFTDELGFAVRMITPADDPTVAVLDGYGLRLRLDATGASNPPSPLTLRLLTEGPPNQPNKTAPNGTVIEFVDANPPLVMPPLVEEFVVSQRSETSAWGTGRAGMEYRDLLPSRLGGRFIASNIRIQSGGLVGDYPHFHKIRFQMIFCTNGWVRVAYEDQGEPLVLHAGDCFLQPPEIRHQVLESSEGLEVVEIGCPAEHETFGDLEIELPTDRVLTDRDFGGQRFVHHVAANAERLPFVGTTGDTGFEYRDVGIADATDGLADVRVLQLVEDPDRSALGLPMSSHGGEFLLLYVLAGSAILTCHGEHPIGPGDSVTIPADDPYGLSDCSPGLELLRVSLP